MKISLNMSCSINFSFCSLPKDTDLASLQNVAILRIVHFKSKDEVQIKSHNQSAVNLRKWTKVIKKAKNNNNVPVQNHYVTQVNHFTHWEKAPQQPLNIPIT